MQACIRLFSITLLSALLLAACAGKAPVIKLRPVDSQLLRGQADALATARRKNVHQLSPSYFESAGRIYEEALAAQKEGASSALIQQKVSASRNLLERALENADLARNTLAAVLAARKDALDAGAPKHEKALCDEADASLARAMRELEKGDVNDAREDAAHAERNFRRAELVAIKKGVLGEARRAIQRARQQKAQRYAPLTFVDAQTLLKKAETTLNTDRQLQGKARELAAQARYEATHAMALTNKMRQLKEQKRTLEQILLEQEGFFHRIGEPLQMKKDFSKGVAGYTKTVVGSIKRTFVDRDDLNDRLARAEQKMKKQGEMIAALEKKSGRLTELQEQLAQQRALQERVKKVRRLFDADEGKVRVEGEDLVLRLYGLSFPPGQSLIEVENFPLLSKVQKVIREFPRQLVIIEGHTDSRGSASLNELLSMERAAAVEQYLLVNATLPANRIASIGWGAQKPVAPNTSAAGRSKNRRIDIRIKDIRK